MELLLEFEISNQHSEKLPPSCHHEDEGICSLRFSMTVHDDVIGSVGELIRVCLSSVGRFLAGLELDTGRV